VEQYRHYEEITRPPAAQKKIPQNIAIQAKQQITLHRSNLLHTNIIPTIK